jgi:hypothetical protein
MSEDITNFHDDIKHQHIDLHENNLKKYISDHHSSIYNIISSKLQYELTNIDRIIQWKQNKEIYNRLVECKTDRYCYLSELKTDNFALEILSYVPYGVLNDIGNRLFYPENDSKFEKVISIINGFLDDKIDCSPGFAFGNNSLSDDHILSYMFFNDNKNPHNIIAAHYILRGEKMRQYLRSNYKSHRIIITYSETHTKTWGTICALIPIQKLVEEKIAINILE